VKIQKLEKMYHNRIIMFNK